MKLKVFQIEDLEHCSYAFASYYYAEKHGFNLDDYKCVCEVEVDADNSLDDFFRMFNKATKEDIEWLSSINYKGRSMSVSDILDLDGHLYYCDAGGWTELN